MLFYIFWNQKYIWSVLLLCGFSIIISRIWNCEPSINFLCDEFEQDEVKKAESAFKKMGGSLLQVCSGTQFLDLTLAE